MEKFYIKFNKLKKNEFIYLIFDKATYTLNIIYEIM